MFQLFENEVERREKKLEKIIEVMRRNVFVSLQSSSWWRLPAFLLPQHFAWFLLSQFSSYPGKSLTHQQFCGKGVWGALEMRLQEQR